MLQRITALIVLAILLLNVASRFPIFKFEQWQIRKAISRKIESLRADAELHVVSVAKNSPEIEWIRAGKEFRYKDELYDVVRSEESDGIINYYCISDGDETQLKKQYDGFIAAQYADDLSSSKSISINVLRIFFSLVYIPEQAAAVHPQWAFRQQYFHAYCCLYTNAYTSITGPPPKSIL